MDEHKVDLYFKSEFNDRFAEEMKFDHVIMCQGFSFKTDYMKRNNMFVDCLSEKGQIFTNEFLQVTNVNPTIHQDLHKGVVKVFPNIFCIGDCSLTPANEEKTVYPAKICASIAASNIQRLNDGQTTGLKAIPKTFPCIYGLTLGWDKGITILNSSAKADKKAAQMKLDYQHHYVGMYRGNQADKNALKKQEKKVNRYLCCCGPLCAPCFPAAKKPTRIKRKQERFIQPVVLNPE